MAVIFECGVLSSPTDGALYDVVSISRGSYLHSNSTKADTCSLSAARFFSQTLGEGVGWGGVGWGVRLVSSGQADHIPPNNNSQQECVYQDDIGTGIWLS